MVNMKTSIFEVMKQNFLPLLDKHPLVKNAKQTRTAKAATDNGFDADMEYHMDLEIYVDGNEHKFKFKVYNSNCLIQVQHAGNGSHQAQNYLQNRCPRRYFAEEVILPFCKSVDETIATEKEKEFVTHLRK